MRPRVPPEPKPRPLHPEPQIPAPQGRTAALRLSYGGCEWCGAPTGTASATGCPTCTTRERGHRERMNALAEREAELRIKVLEQQLTEHTDTNEGPTS
jgi:hypothetical protein